MSNLLERLQNETLPRPVMEAFVAWCVWEQASSALKIVLEKTSLHDVAQTLTAAGDLHDLLAWSEQAVDVILRARRKTGPLGISAAEAAVFEFSSLAKAAGEQGWDPEGAAFFASRVCGWAGWAATDFSQPMQKNQAEEEARQQQEAYLQTLLQRFNQTEI